MNKNIRRLGKFVVLLAVIGGAALLSNRWTEIKAYAKESMPVRHVRIEGRFRYLSRDEVKNALLPVVKTDFFSADVHAVDRAAESIAWVETAEVKRVWPDTVDIRIEEQTPVVRWGENSLLNERGEPFSPAISGELLQLPLITGPRGFERRLLEIMLGLQQSLADQGLRLASFYVTERRSWKLVLAGGMEIELGRQKPLKNFQRLLKVMPVLGKDRTAAIAKIDMRYPNGFAVVWKPGAAVSWPTANNNKALPDAALAGKAEKRKIEH
jgi:cell division protein FtsQ